nr:YetF domain-containing protein [Paenibacillus senegalensis]
MDILKDLGMVTLRIITIFPLVLGITLLIGKRSIASMSVFDYLIIIALGAIIGADLADPTVPHIHTAYTLVIIGLLQKYVAVWVLRSRKFGSLITFEPTIVIRSGHFQNKSLKRIHYSIDNVLQMLRDKGIFEVSQVELAIVEANGTLSV